MPTDLVRALLKGPSSEGSVGSPSALRRHMASGGAPSDTVDRAALAGRAAQSMGWAFAGGYEAALTKLDPLATEGGALAAFCATEDAGAHPRAIRTALSAEPAGGFVLDGSKSFVTLGTEADVLLVVASAGASGGRNVLRVVRVPSRRSGVTLREAPAIAVAAEVGHARATFEGVKIGERDVLPGDGYDDALKPFRTIEDVHVLAAVLGWAVGVAVEGGWSRGWTEEALALVVLLRTLGASPPLAPETHAVLAGALTSAHRLLDAGSWAGSRSESRESWERERALLRVASTVRAARLAGAWERLGASS